MPTRELGCGATFRWAGLQEYRAERCNVIPTSRRSARRDDWSAWMNHMEIAERAATRSGLSGAAAGDAVDGAFDAIAEALADGPKNRSGRLPSAGSPDPGPALNSRQAGPTGAAMLNARACCTMTGVKGFFPGWNTGSSDGNGFAMSGGDRPALLGETSRNVIGAYGSAFPSTYGRPKSSAGPISRGRAREMLQTLNPADFRWKTKLR